MDPDHLSDLFSKFGPVTLKRMFSGYGIVADGVNFAMSLRSGLIFRVDAETVHRYDAEGCMPFQYSTKARTVIVQSYRVLPERLYDDPEDWQCGRGKRLVPRIAPRRRSARRNALLKLLHPKSR